MEPRSHDSHSAVHSRRWNDGVTIHWRGKSMGISIKLLLFLSFFLHSFFIFFVWNLHYRPQFIFYVVTKYKTSFPGHVGFLIWRKTHSSLSEIQETLRIRLLNTIKCWWYRRVTSDFVVNFVWDLATAIAKFRYIRTSNKHFVIRSLISFQK